MDKRIEENIRVKNAISNTFIDLLSVQKNDDISVSTITNKAGVSRMAYYRNFNTKVDILNYYFSDLLINEFRKEYHKDEIDFWTREYGCAFFRIMQKHKHVMLLFDELGYSSLILNNFNCVNEEFAGDMPMNSIERYRLYYAAGASFNGVMEWLRSGCKESIDEMVDSILAFMN